MTYRPLITVASLAGAVLLAVTLVLLSPAERAMGTQDTSSSTSSEESSSSSPLDEPTYLLKEYEGRLAVFRQDAPDDPDLVLDVFIHSLPEFDQQQLRDGIPVRDEKELTARIEDYIS